MGGGREGITFTPPEVVTKVARWRDHSSSPHKAVDLLIVATGTMTSGRERRDTRRDPDRILLPHHVLTRFNHLFKSLAFDL